MMSSTVTEEIYEMVHVSNLIVDGRYQRPCIKAEVDLILADFDLDVFGVLVVSMRKSGECYAVIDGQQRAEAAKLYGLEWVPAHVLVGLSLEDEARKFVKVNKNRKSLRPLQIFKAELLARDPLAMQADELLRKHGFEAGQSRGNDSKWEAINSLLGALREHGACSGEQAADLAVMVAAGWRDLNVIRPAWSDVFLGIVDLALKHWEEIDNDEFIDCLLRTTPTAIIERTRARYAPERGGDHSYGQYQATLEIYNKCRSAKRKIKPVIYKPRSRKKAS